MNSSLDTNVIMRFMRNDVPRQAKKANELLSDQTQVFHISDLVIAEVIFNLQTDKVSRGRIVGALEQFFAMPNIAVNPMVTDKVLPFFAEHPALSFVDCYAAFEADTNNHEPLWTFDKRLSNQHPSAKRLA